MSRLTVYSNMDAYIREENPDTNYGTSISVAHGIIYVGEEKLEWIRGIGNFNVSAVAGKTINSAKLVREVHEIIAGGVSAKLLRVKNHPDTGGVADWTEGGVTWNKYDGTNLWDAAGGDWDEVAVPGVTYTEPTSTGEHEILGLKAFVEDALDNRGGVVSIITKLVDEEPGGSHRLIWRSKDYGSSIWRLVVDYTPAGPAGGLPERGELRGVLRGVVRGY